MVLGLERQKSASVYICPQPTFLLGEGGPLFTLTQYLHGSGHRELDLESVYIGRISVSLSIYEVWGPRFKRLHPSTSLIWALTVRTGSPLQTSPTFEYCMLRIGYCICCCRRGSHTLEGSVDYTIHKVSLSFSCFLRLPLLGVQGSCKEGRRSQRDGRTAPV